MSVLESRLHGNLDWKDLKKPGVLAPANDPPRKSREDVAVGKVHVTGSLYTLWWIVQKRCLKPFLVASWSYENFWAWDIWVEL